MSLSHLLLLRAAETSRQERPSPGQRYRRRRHPTECEPERREESVDAHAG